MNHHQSSIQNKNLSGRPSDCDRHILAADIVFDDAITESLMLHLKHLLKPDLVTGKKPVMYVAMESRKKCLYDFAKDGSDGVCDVFGEHFVSLLKDDTWTSNGTRY